MADIETIQEQVMRRNKRLIDERNSFFAHWQELARFFSPRSGQFLDFKGNTPFVNASTSVDRQNRGDKKHTHIYDNSPLRAVDVGVAGMTAGMTSPARPWFRLRTPDDDLNERHAVQLWLHDVERRMRAVFNQSNTYRAFRRIYEELFVFGTGASIMLPDFQDALRHYPLTAGEFSVGINSREVVDTIYRQFDMTVEQLVERFGYKNVSRRVQNMYTEGQLEAYVPVVHGIEPRRDRNPLKIDNQNMPWQSIYMEASGDKDRILSVSGFQEFPALVPRWKVNGHDAYGEAPAMRALGDAKQLQQEQYRKSQAIDFMTLPPLQVPTSLAEAVAKGPGGITYVDGIQQKIQPAWETNVNLNFLLEDIVDVRQRIAQGLFEDIFLMFTTSRRGVQPPTAEEIIAQQEEKLLMLGPVLENLHQEMLSPKLEKTFAILLRAGAIPPAPPELEGVPLEIQFVSTLAQAQKLIGLNSLDRMIGTVANLATVAPQVLDKINFDAVVDEYSNSLGVDPDLVVAGDQVALIREDRAAREQQVMAAQAGAQTAETAKTLGEVDVNQANQAVQALEQLGGNP